MSSWIEPSPVARVFAASLLSLLLLSGCRIIQQPTAGGQIITENGNHGCAGNTECVIDVNPEAPYYKTFYPLPDEGHIFRGWIKQGASLCWDVDPLEPCTLNFPVASWEHDVFIIPTFAPKYDDLDAEGTILRPGPNYLALCTYEEPLNNGVFSCTSKHFAEYGHSLNLYDFVVNDQSTLLTDYIARSAELDDAGEHFKNKVCGKSGLDYTIDPLAQRPAPPAAQPPEGFSMDIYGPKLLRAAEDYLYYDEYRADAFSYILETLLAYADAGSYLESDPYYGGESITALNDFIGLVIAWNAIEPAVQSAAEVERVEAYLAAYMRRITLYDQELRPGASSIAINLMQDNPNAYQPKVYEDIMNRAYQRDLAAALYGIHSGNNEYFQRAVSRVFKALDVQTRGDGSLIHSSQRGSSALGYSVGTLSYLVMIAELLANQGYDLYDLEIGGKTLATMIAFHIEAFADPTIMNQYTQYRHPLFCNPETGDCNDDKWFNQELQDLTNEFGYTEFSFLEAYLRRFPGTPLSERIREVLPVEQFTPASFFESGGTHSCHYRPL